jgi:uncharacterized protein YqgC (DUF456 family)
LETIGWLLVVLLFILAYAGLLLPALPDAPLALAGFAAYHFLIDSSRLGWGFWVAVTLLTLILFVVDLLSGAAVARKYGGSRGAMVAAVAGALIFPLFLGPVGVIVGPFALVFLLELVRRKNFEEALRIGFGTLVGFLGGVVVKFIAITGMVVWFLFLVM